MPGCTQLALSLKCNIICQSHFTQQVDTKFNIDSNVMVGEMKLLKNINLSWITMLPILWGKHVTLLPTNGFSNELDKCKVLINWSIRYVDLPESFWQAQDWNWKMGSKGCLIPHHNPWHNSSSSNLKVLRFHLKKDHHKVLRIYLFHTQFK